MTTRTEELNEVSYCEGAEPDPAASVLRRVKVLGFDSINRRRYTREAAEAAVGLYEGAKVNTDHPVGPPGNTRGVRERFGWLENVRVEPDGLWADLHYNPRHSFADEFGWWASNKPDCVGLSHNAVGQGHDEGGVFVVEKVVVVRSVDLVADPATTRGLHESVQPAGAKMKLKAFFESAEWRGKRAARVRRRIKRLFEAGYMDPDAEVSPPAEGPPDHMTALRDGFDAACEHIIDKALDGKMDPREALQKLRGLLLAHERLAGEREVGGKGEGEGEEEEEEEGEEEEEEEEGEEEEEEEESDATAGWHMGKGSRKGKMEESVRDLARGHRGVKSLLERVDRLEAEKAVQARREKAARLIEAAKLPKVAVTELFMSQLLEAKDERTMRALVEERRQLASMRSPRSSGLAAGAEDPGDFITRDVNDFAARLKRGR